MNVTSETSYAGLGWRFLAVVIDTVIIGVIFVVIFTAAGMAGGINASDYRGKSIFEMTAPWWTYLTAYGLLFVYYVLFELARGATPGKMALGMRVRSVDGSEPGTRAIVMRNLIRIPEVIFIWYLSSAISCLATPKRQRLGDLAANTVVTRRAAPGTTPVRMAPSASPPRPGETTYWSPAPPPPPPSGWQPTGVSQVRTAAERLDEALEALKAAALGVRGAHHNYLRLSEREIERGGGVTAEFSPEYAAAWHTLADAVIELQHANADAAEAASQAGVQLQEASASHPDLQYLCRELAPYFSAASDADVQEAYLQVARQETGRP